jgi:hypothetical protein
MLRIASQQQLNNKQQPSLAQRLSTPLHRNKQQLKKAQRTITLAKTLLSKANNKLKVIQR